MKYKILLLCQLIILLILTTCKIPRNQLNKSQNSILDSNCCICPITDFPFDIVIKDSSHCINIDKLSGFAILKIKISRRGRIKSVKLNRLDLYMPNDTISYEFYYCESNKYPSEIQEIFYILDKYSRKYYEFKPLKKVKPKQKYYFLFTPIKIGCK